jgi:hypothetical protein
VGERGGREGGGVAAWENQMREREREEGRAWGGGEGRKGARRAGLGWVRLGRVTGQKPIAHTTTDRKPIANRNSSEAKRTHD